MYFRYSFFTVLSTIKTDTYNIVGSWLFRFPTFYQQNFRKKYLFAQIRLERDINEALDASEMNNYGPQKIKKEKKSTKLEPENARCIFFFKMKMDCKYQT